MVRSHFKTRPIQISIDERDVNEKGFERASSQGISILRGGMMGIPPFQKTGRGN